MENISPEILNDAFNICHKYLKSHIGKENIKFITDDPEDVKLDTILIRSPKTLHFLQIKDILKISTIHGLSLIELIAKENRRLGIVNVIFDEKNAEKFVNERLATEIDRPLLQLKNNKKERLSFDTPLNTKWEDITIKFIDGHYVDVIIGKKKKRTYYREMGFEDSRKNLPNKQWEFMKNLSELNGEISWDDKKADWRLKKRKQKLSDALRAFFGMSDDPFYPYWKIKGYKIKIHFMPEHSQIPFKLKDNDSDDISKVLTEYTS